MREAGRWTQVATTNSSWMCFQHRWKNGDFILIWNTNLQTVCQSALKYAPRSVLPHPLPFRFRNVSQVTVFQDTVKGSFSYEEPQKYSQGRDPRSVQPTQSSSRPRSAQHQPQLTCAAAPSPSPPYLPSSSAAGMVRSPWPWRIPGGTVAQEIPAVKILYPGFNRQDRLLVRRFCRWPERGEGRTPSSLRIRQTQKICNGSPHPLPSPPDQLQSPVRRERENKHRPLLPF